MDKLTTLAADIANIVPTITEGRFGDRKVFIAAVWHALRQEGSTLSYADFRAALIPMLQAGQVILARADLVGAMDPDWVRDSELTDRRATFHFILDQSVR